MKKFLTVLLVIAVMFTFSFSSAFAADVTYTDEQLQEQLDAYVAQQVNVMKAMVESTVALYDYDKYGYAAGKVATTYQFTADAIEAGLNAVIDDIEDDMEAAVEYIVAKEAAETDDVTAAELTSYKIDNGEVGDGFYKLGFYVKDTPQKLYTANENAPYLYEAQAPVSKDYYLAKMESDYPEASYPATGTFKKLSSDTDVLTAQEVVTAAKKLAKSSVTAADKTLAESLAVASTSDLKVSAYKTAINAYKAAYNGVATEIGLYSKGGLGVDKVLTNDKVKDQEAAEELATAVKVAKLKAYLYGQYYAARTVKAVNLAPLSTFANYYKDADKTLITLSTTDKSATLFGVNVANVTSVTSAEAKAVDAALLAQFETTLDVAEAYYNAGGAKLAESATPTDLFILNAAKVASLYDEVVAYADGLKAEYVDGEKVYDDAKVDAVTAKAKDVVYAMVNDFSTFTAAAAFGSAIEKAYPGKEVAYLELASNSAIAKFNKYQSDASEKFDGKIVTYGENMTAEADKHYKAQYYVTSDTARAFDEAIDEISENGWEYADIVSYIKGEINDAKSYADVDAAMATADSLLAQLMVDNGTTANTAFTKLRTGYITSLGAYKTSATAYLDAAAYDAADFAAALTKGENLIKTAGNEDAVKANFETAKGYIDAVQPKAEKKAAKEAVEALIKALPYASKVALTDADQIAAARKALDEYNDIIGAAAVTATKLTDAEKALATLQKTDLDKETKAFKEKIAKLPGAGTDAYAPAVLALADEAKALNEKIDAYEDAQSELSLGSTYNLSADSDAVENFVDVTIPAAEVKNVQALAKDLMNEDGTVNADAVKALKEAYNALSEKEQARLESIGKSIATAESMLNDAADKEAKAEKAANDAYVKGVCENVTLKFNGKKTASGKTAFYFGEKGSAKLQKLEDLGYVLEFKYYKAESKTKPTAPKCNTYMSTSKGKKTSDNGYQMIPTKGTKGKYYAYAAEINVYDAEDNLVATIAKSQVNFGWAKWTGKTVK